MKNFTTQVKYKIEIFLLSDGWVNSLAFAYDNNQANPKIFDTKESAKCALISYVDYCDDQEKNGNMFGKAKYSNYRIAEVH